jgi:hypothetical protein
MRAVSKAPQRNAGCSGVHLSNPFKPFPRQTRRAGYADAVLATNDFRERLVGDKRFPPQALGDNDQAPA